jgi:uncharacterized membrane protein (DUF106 family)
MKVNNKIIFTVSFALLIILALASLASVRAASNVDFQVSISANNKGVSQEASYTIIISNVGSDNLASLNVTIPGAYSNIKNPSIAQQPSGQNWNINESEGFIALSDEEGLVTGQSVTFLFDAKNPQVAGTYEWTVGGSNGTDATSITNPQKIITSTFSVDITSILPAIAILGIAAGIAFLNSGLNRILINFFIGWEQYRVMQKEMAEYRSETMAAARANDKKQMEKLKKRQSQINAMQAKMMKPQMVQFGISFLYIIVWFLVLTPTFGGTSMALVPGFGPVSVFYLYPIFSLFLGLISSRIIGIMPIEQ